MVNERKVHWALAAVLLLVAGLYAPSLGNGFAMDDHLVARATQRSGEPNAYSAELRPIGDYFAASYDAGHGQPTALYRPMTILSFALLNQVQRRPADPDWEALPQHMCNVLLHLLAVVLVFALLGRLGVAGGPAVVGALVFGVHAIHSEAVTSVVGRAELLALCFGGVAALLHLGQGPRPVNLRALRGAAAALCLFCAFASKESALAWALALPMLAAARELRPGAALNPILARELMRAAAVAAVPLSVYLWLRAGMIASLPSEPWPVDYLVNPLAHVEAATRVSTAIVVWANGLGKTLLPVQLCADYGAVTYDIVERVTNPRLWIAGAALLAVATGAVCSVRRAPLLFVAGGLFFGFSFITSNVAFPIGTIFGERHYYAPSLAVAALAAWLSRHRLARRSWAIAALAAWVVTCSAIIVQRNGVWRDDETLFTHEADNNPSSVRMLLCAAGQHMRRGEFDDAEPLLDRAVDLLPGYALSWNNLAQLYMNTDRWPDAEAALRRGLTARWRVPGRGQALLHLNLGLVLRELGRVDDARSELDEALRIDPDAALARRARAALPPR